MAQDTQHGLEGLVGMAKAGTRTQLALIHTLYGGRSVLNHLNGALSELEPEDVRQMRNVLNELTTGAQALLIELERMTGAGEHQATPPKEGTSPSAPVALSVDAADVFPWVVS